MGAPSSRSATRSRPADSDRSAASTSTSTPRARAALRGGVEAGAVAGDDHQVTTVGGQSLDERGTDTGRGAGDQSGGHDLGRVP